MRCENFEIFTETSVLDTVRTVFNASILSNLEQFRQLLKTRRNENKIKSYRKLFCKLLEAEIFPVNNL